MPIQNLALIKDKPVQQQRYPNCSWPAKMSSQAYSCPSAPSLRDSLEKIPKWHEAFLLLQEQLIWPAVKTKYFCSYSLMPSALPRSYKPTGNYICSCKLLLGNRHWHQAAISAELFLSSEEMWGRGHYARKAKPIPASPLFCNPLVFTQRCACLLVGTTASSLKSPSPGLQSHFFADTEVQQDVDFSHCFKASNLHALPISIILMTSSAQLTCLSWRPTTWTCCLPSSRTRSFAFLFKRSNTYIQATKPRQIWITLLEKRFETMKTAQSK